MLKSPLTFTIWFVVLCVLLFTGIGFAETTAFAESDTQEYQDAISIFPDVPGDSWSAGLINQFRDRGFTTGYPDGTFRPQASVTRSEFVTFVNRTFGFTETASTTTGAAIAFGRDESPVATVPASQVALPFTDVPQAAWYVTQVRIAFREGYLKGYPDKTFRPLKPITRQEAAAVINRLLQLKQEKTVGILEPLPVWAETDIRALVDHGIMTINDGSFRPEALMTREEMAVSLMTVVLQQEAARNELENGSVDATGESAGDTDGVGADGSDIVLTAEVIEAIEGTSERLNRVLEGETSYAQLLDDTQRAIVRDVRSAMLSYLENHTFDIDAAAAAVRVKYQALSGGDKVELRNAISASVPLIWLNTLDEFF